MSKNSRRPEQPWPVSHDSIDFLAIIKPVDYELSRRDIAKNMQVRIAFLDKLVQQRRREIAKLGIHDEVESRFGFPVDLA
jgi:hypothetical protein